MKESTNSWRRRRARGQSIVEFALMAPILLILLSGLFEFGFMFSYYLAVLDAARNASRFSSDNQFDIRDGILTCTGAGATRDFYRQAACEAMNNLESEEPTISLCLPGGPITEHCDGSTWVQMDDVIVSVFSVLRKPSAQIVRFPDEGCPEWGWSLAADMAGQAQCAGRVTNLHLSQWSSNEIKSLLDPGAPNTGFVLVEINYQYWQILSLPWFTQFVSDPVPFHLYALWPLVSAEPTSTPK